MVEKRKERILMLLANAWETDSRVIREATALAQAGYDTHVICDQNAPAYHTTIHNDVTYHCLAAANELSVLEIKSRYLAHCKIIVASSKDGITLAQGGAHARTPIFRWIAALPLIPVAALLLLLLIALRWALISPLRRRLTQRITVAISSNSPDYASRLYRLIHRLHRLIHRALNLTRRSVFAWLQLDAALYLNRLAARSIPIAEKLAPTIVHAHDLITLSTGYTIAQLTGARLIYDAHELETHTNYWGLSTSMRSWIAFYEKILCRKTDAVITVCESIADWLRDSYDIPRPIVVHNTPDFSPPTSPSTTIAQKTLRNFLALPEDAPLAVYVGSVTIDRGIEQCVEALAYAPALHMAFVGPRYSETEKQIRTISQRLGVESRVHLVDPVPSAEVTKFISDADCSVMAIQNVCLSYYFCFPNKLLESVLAGVPVVAARLIELERFVERFRVGLIADETNPKALAQAMKTIIQQKANFLPSATTRSEIVKVYGWAAQRARLLALYARLTEQGIDIPKKLTGRRDQAMSRANQSQNGA